MTQKMRAISPRTWGGPEVLELIEVDRPVPIATEVLVRVHAAAINPTDWKSRRSGAGYWHDPAILGYDVAGVVEQVGLGVTLYQPGDEVFGMPWFPRQAGAYAQYVTAPARQFARKPAGLTFVEAAALPLAALTAWQSLIETGRLLQRPRALFDRAHDPRPDAGRRQLRHPHSRLRHRPERRRLRASGRSCRGRSHGGA